MSPETLHNPEIDYPFRDGEPMADSLLQAEWMMMLCGNLDAILDCFVGMNNFWFPREGHPEDRLAPDVYAAFGRPKGNHRRSYKQWEEDNVPVTVIFEILSPSNRPAEMANKFLFYDEHGVEEYYIYDPFANRLEIWIRHGSTLRRVQATEGFVSPRMGIRFDQTTYPDTLTVWRPDGRRFVSLSELDAERADVQSRLTASEASLRQAEAELQERETERLRLARIVELGRRARRGTATAQELEELERLDG